MKDPTKKVLLLFLCLPFWAPAQSVMEQMCDLQISNAPIPQVLEQLRENCGLDLVYSERFFKKEKPVSIQAKGWTVKRILDKILAKADVGYRELDGQLVFFLSDKKKPKKLTLNGYIEDAESGERLIAAAIYCPELDRGTITNEYGFFSLNLPAGTQNVRVSYLGYQEEERTVELAENRFLTLSLQPALTLAEVLVTPNLVENELLPSPFVGTKLNPGSFPASPDLGGESDLFRVVQMLPGVQTGADGFGGLNVRGSGSEHNLILLDGVPVYNPAHMFGILSIFNTSAVKSTQVIKGGIPARYGGRLSSIIDVRTREGNTKKWGLEASGDFISGKAAVHGPFAKGKGTLLLTGRMSYDDFLLGESLQRVFFFGEQAPVDVYLFNDFNGKLSYRFSEKDRLYLSYYRGRDEFSGSFEDTFFEDTPDGESFEVENQESIKIIWGNDVASLRWNHISNPQLFSNTTLTLTRYEFLSVYFSTLSALDEDFEEEYDSGIYSTFGSDIIDIALRTDFEKTFNQSHYFRYGAGLTQHFFRPEKSFDEFTAPETGDLDSLDSETFAQGFSTDFQAQEFEFYFEDEFKLGDKWHFNLGLRLSTFVQDEIFVTPEPRLSARYRMGDNWKITASIDRTSQYLHRLSFNEVNLPNDVWIPADEEFPPQRAWQATLGASTNLTDGLEMTVEAFAKRTQNEKSYAFIYESEGEEIEFIPTVDGTARGLEFFLRKTGQRTGGWLSYTLSKSERTLQDSLSGFKFDFQYDRRHDLKLFLYHLLNDRWKFGLNWLYGSPVPRLFSQDPFNAEDTGLNIKPPYPLRQSERIDPYRRVDLSASYNLKFKKTEHTFKVSVNNLFDHGNTVFYRPNSLGDEPVEMLPRLWGVYYGFKF